MKSITVAAMFWLAPHGGFAIPYPNPTFCIENYTEHSIQFELNSWPPNSQTKLPIGIRHCEKEQAMPCTGDPNGECALQY